jgi:hypothetical protein
LDDLKQAVFATHSLKASGPDGFLGFFFKKCWETVCHDLLGDVNCAFLTQGKNWNLLNTANICVIPKKQDATSLMWSEHGNVHG